MMLAKCAAPRAPAKKAMKMSAMKMETKSSIKESESSFMMHDSSTSAK